MFLRQDKSMTIQGFGIHGVVTHDREEACGDDIGGRATAGEMAARCFSRGLNAFDAELRGLVLERSEDIGRKG